MKTCSTCGGTDKMDPNVWRGSDSARRMTERSCCFTCMFWWEKVEWSNDPDEKYRVVRVDGVHRTIGREPDASVPRHILGHGGCRFHFRFKDGHEVVSHNVWHQGKIPEHFRHLLPDNAEVVNGS